MHVVLKFTLAILALLVAVLTVEAALRLSYEREQFEKDVLRGQQLVGRAVRPSFEAAWRTNGLEAAQRLLRQAQGGESEISIRLVSTRPGAAGGVPAAATLRGNHRALTVEQRFIEKARRPGVVYTYLPLKDPAGDTGSALELAESLTSMERRLARSRYRVLWTALILFAGCGMLAITVGEHLLGRPIRGLVARAARIATGDLSPLPRATKRDEIGQLANGLSKMVEGLASARDRVERETEARMEAERRLRHGERLASVGSLAAGVAHELGTPLQIVAGRARMIERDAEAGPAKRHASIIGEQAVRMEEIVRHLLGLSHPASSHRVTLEMAGLVQELMELFIPQAEQAGVELVADIKDTGRVLGDHNELMQILSNLVKNALFVAKKRIEIGVSRDRTQRLFDPSSDTVPTSDTVQEWICVEVRDDGPGVNESLRSKIFDPFFTTKDVGQGTGLGLALAHSIATEHRGWLELDSKFEQGGLFRLILPALSEDACTTSF